MAGLCEGGNEPPGSLKASRAFGSALHEPPEVPGTCRQSHHDPQQCQFPGRDGVPPRTRHTAPDSQLFRGKSESLIKKIRREGVCAGDEKLESPGKNRPREPLIIVLEKTDLQEEMSGHLPTKVRNITISGPGLTSVPHNLFKGVRSPRLHLALRNTSVETLPKSLFEQTNWVKNLSLDVRNNSLHVLGNPNTGEFPGAPRTVFLTELQMEGNKWTCDCQLGSMRPKSRSHDE
ncbi:hypothetical protein ANN_14037 [Periplaneta americana]|uniref:Uncharacterized protein n=1 Tax=Periplaneta americana TaxID=6978 RepID=A0ABQ8SVS5_PERAM|nr:hypothetical protein ANN_14037 [Periplaneta americana]